MIGNSHYSYAFIFIWLLMGTGYAKTWLFDVFSIVSGKYSQRHSQLNLTKLPYSGKV